MEKENRNIIKEKGENESIVYRDSGFKEEIDDSRTDSLSDCFTLIVSKFKSFLDLLGEGDENVAYGHVLGAVIKDVETELEDIAQFIEKTIGEVDILYNDDRRWNNFYSKTVVGLDLTPTDMKAKEA